MKILLLEDDKSTANLVVQGFQQARHIIDHINDGKKGLHIIRNSSYDVLIIERMLPSLDGLSIVRILRENQDQIPILMISMLDKVDECVRSLRGGCDDYLMKPFAFVELEARVEALLRRTTRYARGIHVPTQLRSADLVLDLVRQMVILQGKHIMLQQREFRLLKCLLEHKGQIVTRSMLLSQAWDYNFTPHTNIIDVHISRLRHKIEVKSQEPIIKTVRGSGYVIEK